MPSMPKAIPSVVLMDNFSFPKTKLSIKTKKGDKVEINDAKPLVMNFSEKVVNPLAKTIIRMASRKALPN